MSDPYQWLCRSCKRFRDGPVGVKMDAVSLKRCQVNVGNCWLPVLLRIGAVSSEGASGGGVFVVVRGRESRPHGEGRQRALGLRLGCEEVVVE